MSYTGVRNVVSGGWTMEIDEDKLLRRIEKIEDSIVELKEVTQRLNDRIALIRY